MFQFSALVSSFSVFDFGQEFSFWCIPTIIINKNIPFITLAIISDSNGRYVIVTGEIYNTPIILANVYVPNFDDERFISSVLASLPNLHTHNLILAGDFNFVIVPVLDRSSNKQHSLSKSAKLLQKIKVS